jgi:phasin
MSKTPLNYEVPVELRDFAEKSVEQAKKAVDGFLGAATKAVSAVETQTSTVQTNSKEVVTKAIGYAEQNLAAAFDLAQKLVRAKDIQEVVQHQSEYLKQQMANLQAQMQEIGTHVQGSMQKAASEAQATMQKAATEAQATVQKATEAVTKRK